jgi:hypothetical protein
MITITVHARMETKGTRNTLDIGKFIKSRCSGKNTLGQKLCYKAQYILDRVIGQDLVGKHYLKITFQVLAAFGQASLGGKG